MIFSSFRLWTRSGRAHSARLCSRLGLLLSMALRPISISRSTTPYPFAAPSATFILVGHGIVRQTPRGKSTLTFLFIFLDTNGLNMVINDKLNLKPMECLFSISKNCRC
ncbi:unnamed protein product [Spirodela intermedia]|uniref:Uncharacterized protein n=1 Tax=Spirodela intermedia TaxID=51605 RepID=A0A7I8KCA2_SPIIN|nr:unnamed protein product [Spirodela intermedia]